MKNALIILLVFLGAWTLGYTVGGRNCREPSIRVDTVRDTVSVFVPVLQKETHVRRIWIPARDGNTGAPVDTSDVIIYEDSSKVSLPITQRCYADSTYRIYVSGFKPRLDSCFFYPRTVYVRERVPSKEFHPPKQKRFGVSIQGGYGITPKGLQPYLGIGLHCRIL